MEQILTTLSGFQANYWATLGVTGLCAYLGVFTVLRRIVFTGAALAQAAAAGVGASYWLQGLALPAGVKNLMAKSGATIGSLSMAIVSALILARGERRGRLTADSLVGVLFACSSALGVLFVWRSSAGLVELKNILAGDVLLSSAGDLQTLWVGVVALAVLHGILQQRFLLVAYDPAFARAQGLKVKALERVFLASLAVAVAVSLRAAGLMLVFGTLVLPPLVGLRVGARLRTAWWIAGAAAWASALLGFWFAAAYNLPVAPTVVAWEAALLVIALISPLAARWVALSGGVAAPVLGLSLVFFEPARSVEPQAGATNQTESQDGPDDRLARAGQTLADASKTDAARLQAADFLFRSGKLEALSPLLNVMGDPQEAIARAATQAAGELASSQGEPGGKWLMEQTSGPDAALATYAARLLVRIEHPKGWPLLVERLADPQVPLLLLDEIHVELKQANEGDGLGFDAFGSPEDNAAAVEAWRSWAKQR